MDLRKLKTLIDLVSDSGISELEVSEGEDKVRIVNTRGGPTASTYAGSSPSTVAVAKKPNNALILPVQFCRATS